MLSVTSPFRASLYLSLGLLAVGSARSWAEGTPSASVNGLPLHDDGPQARGKANAALLAEASAFSKQVQPFLTRHCTECHGAEKQKGDVRLDTLAPAFSDKKTAELWLDVMDQIRSGDMPPKKANTHPTAAETEPILTWIEAQTRLAEAARKGSGGSQGQVVLRRLNRAEYRNTVRDLLGLASVPDLDLPDDTPALGFNNIGSALTVSPTQLQQYLVSAEKVLSKAIVTGERPETKTIHLPIKDFGDDQKAYWAKGPIVHGNAKLLEVQGDSVLMKGPSIDIMKLPVPVEGEYILRLKAGRTGDTARQVRVKFVDRGRETVLYSSEITAPADKMAVYEAHVSLRPGTFRMSVDYDTPINIYNNPLPPPAPIAMEWFEMEGPLYPAWPPESHQRIFFKGAQGRPDLAYAQEIVSRFLTFAYRRPGQPAEIDRVVKLIRGELDQKASFEEAVKYGLEYVLCSPDFLYLVERGQAGGTAGARRLTDWELASRLSFFLWSSMPDSTLLQLAARNQLHEPAALAKEVQRMLADPRAAALSENFASQWLELGKLGTFQPNKTFYPTYEAYLEESMARETKAFFMEVLKENLNVSNFLSSDFAMLNERLAALYHIDGVKGDALRKVALTPDAHRGGLMTQASILTLTSDGTRPKPVARGKWILDNLLGTPPPPPPANVGEFEPVVPGAARLSIRARLEKHREDERCASCHAKIDPLGFALENYDAVGGWRTEDRTAAGQGAFPKIDAHGALPDGRSLGGAADLAALLVKDQEKFHRCLSTKLLTYALGRTLEYSDRATVDQLTARLHQSPTLPALITAIAQSAAFQTK